MNPPAKPLAPLIEPPESAAGRRERLRMAAQRHMSKLVVSPTCALVLLFIYGFILWTGYLSLTGSRMLPVSELAGIDSYLRLWRMPRWSLALTNLLVFGGLFVALSLAIGVALAVLLDRRLRTDGVLRIIYLYPMALSYIVTGVVWRWILDPTVGLQHFVRDLGFESFAFDWVVRQDRAIYALVIAAVWQSSGFVMALFLAAFRGVDPEIVRAAELDGASVARTYSGIVLPSVRPVFMSAVVILINMAVKNFDLVIALTGGGPGHATDLPATFLYEMTFRRDQINIGAASAMTLLATVMAIIVPYLYSELRRPHRG
jgi:glucose/mannose transport system permease protein